jgi:hypothetical protein
MIQRVPRWKRIVASVTLGLGLGALSLTFYKREAQAVFGCAVMQWIPFGSTSCSRCEDEQDGAILCEIEENHPNKGAENDFLCREGSGTCNNDW